MSFLANVVSTAQGSIYVPKSVRKGDLWDELTQAVRTGSIHIGFASEAEPIETYEEDIRSGMHALNQTYSMGGKLRFYHSKSERSAKPVINVTVREMNRFAYQDGNNVYIHPEVIHHFPSVVAHEVGHQIFGPGHHLLTNKDCIMHASGYNPKLCNLHKKRLEEFLHQATD